MPNDMGALAQYAATSSADTFQPMGASIGILSPIPSEIRGKQQRHAYAAERALRELDAVLAK